MNRREKREKKKELNIMESVVRIVKQYMPELVPMLNKLTDNRNIKYITYEMKEILFTQILAYISSIKSMRNMTVTFDTEETIQNISKILNKELDEIPHYDTINNVLAEVNVDEVRNIIKRINTSLIRSKMFDRYRIMNKYFEIVVDGTGISSFKERHCKHCLTRTYNKEQKEEYTIYYHYVLEAKLVLGDIVISIDSEFVENEEENVDKQDCEIKAFKRMAERIKKNYPRLPIVISGDALYACKPVIDICKENKWGYILRFKSERIKSLGLEIEGLEKAESIDTRKSKTVYWNKLKYGEVQFENEENVLKHYEVTTSKRTEFMWIVSFKITEKNKEELVYAGRQRWKIENEGFNDQKNITFDIEHVYSYNYNAMKIHYLLIQIAHLIRQLLEKGISIIRELKLTKKEVSKLIELALTNTIINIDLDTKIQLRYG